MKKTKNSLFLGRQWKLPKLDLLAVQKESYNWFLQKGIPKALKEISPVEDFTGKNFVLEFADYYLGEVRCSVSDALTKGLTYDAPLRVKVILHDKKTGRVQEQEVFFGDLPIMTENGTFIINGIERAVVSQLVRSPGAFFSGEVDPSSGRMLYRADIRPMRGSWLELQVNRNDVITVRIDRHRKFPATMFLKAIGFESDEAILERFVNVDTDPDRKYIEATLEKDPSANRQEALLMIYEKMRPGEPMVLDNAQALLDRMFFNPRTYDMGRVGRYKLNKRLGLAIEEREDGNIFHPEDFEAVLSYLIGLQKGEGQVDDIDHLSNRRVRCVGELVYATAFRLGLLRMQRSIKEKMTLAKSESNVLPTFLVNARPLIAAINDFFRRNRLSTILDQTNPLSEIDNLRRLSVMGRGGVTKERASFSMRDINSSQYGRICPVRSPEGPNIGLVTYMSLYTRVNDYGFLETPYKKVIKEKVKGKLRVKVSDEIVYLQADEEQEHYITHASIKIDDDGYILEDWVPVRYKGFFKEASIEDVDYIDLVPRQVVGTSASLIPFLAHDEANRALMGSHMQCQAVPLVRPEVPVVGTGMEAEVIRQIRRAVWARRPGRVVYVDSEQVVIEVKTKDRPASDWPDNEWITFDGKFETYRLQKYKRTAQSTCYSQKPLVSVGEMVNSGQLIIDSPASEDGELALGRNLLIAYAALEGLGYEDAIIISDKLVREDLLTSIHINEYSTSLMDTNLGPEELTRDIPNVSEKDLKHLADDGIVVVGSRIGPNDILVGKVAPKGETELTAEERLLRAIFGEKAREVRDTSLRMPHGEEGTVIDVTVLDRKSGDKLDPGVLKVVKVKVAQMRKITVGDKLAGRHGNKGVISKIVPSADMPYLADGTPVDIIISPLSVLARMNLGQLFEAHLGWAASKLNLKVRVPVFERLPEKEILAMMKEAGLPSDGKVVLYDGRTGDRFDQKSVVGVAFIMKLIHMVDDKIHARSTGPYSLVTQQPLGGRAQMGGQRLGEMEVWALEAHSAAHLLQEMLTIKSDDVLGRAKAFEAIVKGVPIPEAKVPESFNVLAKELQGLGIAVLPIGAVEKERDIAEDQPVAASDDTRDSNTGGDDDQTDDSSLNDESEVQETDKKKEEKEKV